MVTVACPYCTHVGAPVEVHGHLQCAVCHINIEPCCSGQEPNLSDSCNGKVSSNEETPIRPASSPSQS